MLIPACAGSLNAGQENFAGRRTMPGVAIAGWKLL